jgi:glycine cleavage system T protein
VERETAKAEIKNSLYENHRTLGASFTEFQGFLIPDSYGDVESEWGYVRKTVGVLDLPHRAIFEMTGSDSVRFLQGMVSNDVERLQEGHGTYATVLTTQGKVVSDLRIYRTAHSFLLETYGSVQEKVVQHLERYLIADEVELHSWGEHAFLSLQGPRSAQILEEIGVSVPEGEYRHTPSQIQDSEARYSILCFRVSLTGEAGFLILLETAYLEPMWHRLLDKVRRYGGGPIGLRALQILRMEAGIPWYGTDFDDSNFPLEVGLDRVVSQSKGCYLGQEVMERIRARGHVNKRLVIFHGHGSVVPSSGARVYREERDIGEVKSGTFSIALGRPIALGYIHRDFVSPGTEVSIRSAAETHSATIASCPVFEVDVEGTKK